MTDFNFRKWRKILLNLENLIQIDVEFQETKVHDKNLCSASERLAGVLGGYTALCREAIDCLQQNLQVQKTKYMEDVVHSVVARMHELKHNLHKLNSSNVQYLSSGLANHKLTTYDLEMEDLPPTLQRSDEVRDTIEDAISRGNQRKEEIIRMAKEAETEGLDESIPEDEKWWENEQQAQNVIKGEGELNSKVQEIYMVEEKLSEETFKRKNYVALIQAHEKSRQVTLHREKAKLKRETWKKELQGLLLPPARLEIRERGAIIIQKAMRAYFDLKRKKLEEFKRDQILGIRQHRDPNTNQAKLYEQMKLHTHNIRTEYETQWKNRCNDIKDNFIRKRKDDILDDYRDKVRYWFHVWHKKVNNFYDIPKHDGAELILREEVPEPEEWLDKYKEYLDSKKKNKGSTALQKKQKKLQEMKAQLEQNRMEKNIKKQEATILNKLMRNPKKHPGFTYSPSDKTSDILQAIERYHHDWDDLDKTNAPEVKKGTVVALDEHRMCMEVKLELTRDVVEDMKKEQKKLKKALRKDYQNREEAFPEPMKIKKRKQKKKKEIKIPTSISDQAISSIEELVIKGILKKYPKTNFGNFSGDHNFVGDILRCLNKQPLPCNGEIRSVWWDQCRDLVNGFRRLLLVGPRSSGKTVLIHTMATKNGAYLLELDPLALASDETLDASQLVDVLAATAKALQPCVLYIKHVHRLYYKRKKVPKEESNLNLNSLRQFIVKKLCKKINKIDKVTIVGTCIDPWQTKYGKMLKSFPTVVLIPNTNYSIVVQIINEWISKNPTIPLDMNVSTLAHMFKGCPYGRIVEGLHLFLGPERLVRIAAQGLKPEEVFHFFEEREMETIDYEQYLKWYENKTSWGKRERRHRREQLEYQTALDKWTQQQASQRTRATVSSAATSLGNLTK